VKSLLRTLFDEHSWPWYRAPANLLRGKVHQIKSKLGLTSLAARRHAMVGPSHLWQMKRDFQISFLKSVGMSPEHYVLDFGCGVLRGGLPIIEYLNPGNYYGIESRKAVLEEGIATLHESGLHSKAPTLLLVADISQATLDRRFDFIWAFSVLIHMEDDVLDTYLQFVSTHLQDKGRMYANVKIGNERDGRWQEFPVVSRSREFYTAAAERHGLRTVTIGTLQSLGHVSGSPGQDLQIMLQFLHASP